MEESLWRVRRWKAEVNLLMTILSHCRGLLDFYKHLESIIVSFTKHRKAITAPFHVWVPQTHTKARRNHPWLLTWTQRLVPGH